MSKELIEQLRACAKARDTDMPHTAILLNQAADALEAKAAPVGELIKVVDDIVMERDIMGDIYIKTGGVTVAKVIYQYPHTDNASTRRLANLIVDAMSGAAYQRAQQPQSAEAVVLSVWYGPMPESNGKQNYTALLHRKGESLFDGAVITLDRSEYPDRVRYEADRVRYLIGELAEEPCITDYDADAHSGYVAPPTTPQPSAVVMPDKREFLADDPLATPLQELVEAHEIAGWNACLDEFARLNGKEVGRG